MIKIPVGKKVRLLMKGQPIKGLENTELVLSSELTISLNSKFGTLLGDTSNDATKMIDLFGAAVQAGTGFNISTKFKEQGYQIWESTDPIKFSFEVMLQMKTSAEKDVWEPAKALMKLPLPKNPNSNGVGLIAPGPSIVEALGGTTNFGAKYSFRCGVFYLPNVIIESVEPTLSAETDDRNFPLWCSLKIDVTSIFTATQDQIDAFTFVDFKEA